jgi:hypothetical protein
MLSTVTLIIAIHDWFEVQNSSSSADFAAEVKWITKELLQDLYTGDITQDDYDKLLQKLNDKLAHCCSHAFTFVNEQQ